MRDISRGNIQKVTEQEVNPTQENEGRENSSPESKTVVEASNMQSQFSGDNPGRRQQRRALKIALWVVGIVFVFGGVVAGAIWGYMRYERVYVSVPTETLFPKENDLVVRVAIQKEAPQVVLLQKTLEKFPGYAYLRKEMDKTGEGKDADESFLDAWRETGLNFTEDILPALGDTAWLVVPDLHPVEQLVGQELGMAEENARDRLAFEANDQSGGQVLGQSSDRVRSTESTQKNIHIPALDFMVASPISDMQKALSVMEKFGTEKDRYRVTKVSYKGYTYADVFDTKFEAQEQGSDTSQLRLNASRTYHALLGGNWVSASRDDWMKEMIDRRASRSMFSFSQEAPSLEQNTSYTTVADSLDADGESLLSAYYKWDAKTTCGMGEFCSYGIKDQGIREGGVSLRLSEDGLIMRSYVSKDSQELKQQSNKYADGLAREIAKNIEGRWGDVFMEIPDSQGAYYDFKRNFLTDKGLEQWDRYIQEGRSVFGVDVERDIIDRMAGSAGFVLYTSKSAFPAGAVLLQIDQGDMLVRKILDSLKRSQESMYAQYEEMCRIPENKAFCQNIAIPQISFEEREVSGGKVFRNVTNGISVEEALASPFEICGGTRTDGSLTVVTSSCALAEQLVSGIAPESSLAQDAEYSRAQDIVGESGYSRVHMVPLGMFYAFSGAYTAIISQFESQESPVSGVDADAQGAEDMRMVIEGLEGIMKTLPSFTSQQETQNSGTIFVHIKELPADEKSRAEDAVRVMIESSRN